MKNKFKVGDRVIRGRNWDSSWGDQDKKSIGKVIETESDLVNIPGIKILWDGDKSKSLWYPYNKERREYIKLAYSPLNTNQKLNIDNLVNRIKAII